MLIDSHNHLGGPDKGDGKSQSVDEIIAAMDKSGVDRAVVFPFNVDNPGVSFANANDYIAGAVKTRPSRLIGFCRLDPNFGELAVKELDRCVNGLGLRGIKLHPTSQNFPLGHPALLDILAAAEELRVPVVFDTGKKMSPPSGIAILAARFPALRIIMAHMNLYEESIQAARTAPNIYLGTTGYFNLKRLAAAIRELGVERFIAGSDSPYIKMDSEMGKFLLMKDLTDDERRLVTGGNAMGLLGLRDV